MRNRCLGLTLTLLLLTSCSNSEQEKEDSSISKRVLNIVNKNDKKTVKLAISPEEVPKFTVADQDLYRIYDIDGTYIVQELESFKTDAKIDYQYEISAFEFWMLSFYLDRNKEEEN
ncbi:hypothetical protein QUF49_15820 [Fictibacillus sp. b24]|uniref:hypothetical protein n=1 Tax=Fictibacillus sp. b24 TaxID=3055863 RepID=UPI0025A1DFEE|nr:hypothetical protein [Fictibacillus sp. b24]MDM5317479.1 hypothetical protein [Fictibacillus sp. b24]